MKLWKRFIEWLNEDDHSFDAEYDRIHSEINEDIRILTDATKMSK